MAKHVSVSRFSRLLQELNTPVYVLDEKHAFIYFNDALVRWTNADADALIGQTCRYHTSASRLHHEIVAASLAPPPEVEQGQRTRTVLAVDAVQKTRYRRAEFFPLALGQCAGGTGDGSFGTLVLVDTVDLSPEEASDLRLQESASNTNPEARSLKPGAFSSEACSFESLQAKELHRVLFALRRHQAGRYRFETLLGNTPAIQLARQQAMLAAKMGHCAGDTGHYAGDTGHYAGGTSHCAGGTSHCAGGTVAPVLIVGPPGSGRETLAGAIHYGRVGEHSGGMIPVDCHALPDELIDTTIRAFYRRYARAEEGRGARDEGRDVRVTKQCHTLLLNNADLLEPEQANLVVSVLENNPGNMRVIGTSSLEPQDWQNHPTLPWRLATIKIVLPPLTERAGDIPLLAQWFLEQQNRLQASGIRLQGELLAGVPAASSTNPEARSPSAIDRSTGSEARPQRSGFAADALDLLTLYHWPGNIDELMQVVAESHANACATGAITGGTLVRAIDLPVRLRQAADAQAVSQVEEQIDLEDYLHSLERELIQRAHKAARGNKAKAARLLGMTRPRLYRRLEQLGLQASDFGFQEDEMRLRSPKPEARSPEQEDRSPADMPDFRELNTGNESTR